MPKYYQLMDIPERNILLSVIALFGWVLILIFGMQLVGKNWAVIKAHFLSYPVFNLPFNQYFYFVMIYGGFSLLVYVSFCLFRKKFIFFLSLFFLSLLIWAVMWAMYYFKYNDVWGIFNDLYIRKSMTLSVMRFTSALFLFLSLFSLVADAFCWFWRKLTKEEATVGWAFGTTLLFFSLWGLALLLGQIYLKV